MEIIFIQREKISFAAGDIFSWGKSARGRLGRLDDEPGVPKKVAINGEDPFSIVSISCSHGNTLVAIRRKLICR